MDEKQAPQIYQAIADCMADLCVEGISKDRFNDSPGGKYHFRGIDDVYNALSPIMSRHGIVLVPRYSERATVERQSNAGKALFYVSVRGEFMVCCAADGSRLPEPVVTYGEAMDSGDKGTNKAMSAAFKYACFQLFCIPTEGDNDADATTHDVKPREQRRFDREDDVDPAPPQEIDCQAACAKIVKINEVPHLEQWMADHKQQIIDLGDPWSSRIKDAYLRRLSLLRKIAAEVSAPSA